MHEDHAEILSCRPNTVFIETNKVLVVVLFTIWNIFFLVCTVYIHLCIYRGTSSHKSDVKIFDVKIARVDLFLLLTLALCECFESLRL